jgi:ATP-dependent DNA helicase RecQ
MTFDSNRALQLLRQGAQSPLAVFREGQEQAIRHVVEANGRILVVQKTGWGKSFVYFIAAKLLREQGRGVTILVSPLLALMRNQIEAARRMGLSAVTINSDNEEEWGGIEAALLAQQVDVLIIAPERFANSQFIARILPFISTKVGLLVVDEAHCISDWGHDFRPHYRLLERIIRALPPNLPVLGTTATANNRVMSDLQEVLGPNLAVTRGALDRPSLTLQTIRLDGQADRLAWLSENIKRISGSGIVYVLTARDANIVSSWLTSEGIVAESYTSGTPNRSELEDKLQRNEVKALVATTALGMGYDKPDLAFVFHYQIPGSVVAYYQQVGRAGRGADPAYGVLLQGDGDLEITNWFIRSAFPTPHEVAEILGALNAGPLTVPEMLNRLNIGRSRIEKALELLRLESPAPVIKEGARWMLTSFQLSQDFWRRAERLTELRHQEAGQMLEYASLPFGQHMAYLMNALDSPHSHIPQPALPPLPVTPSTISVARAVKFLRRTSVPIQPRKQWPPGGLPKYNVKGWIPVQEQAQEGRSLSIWGDGGWGGLVRLGRYEQNFFDDQLVEACAQMILDWAPLPSPTWVTAIPSLRHPDLVPSFAKRLATKLGLPYSDALTKVQHSQEQKGMANSAQQARNVDGTMSVDALKVLHGPVLLVDDIVNSRWTYTIAAWLLSRAGCPAVWPVALSKSGIDE